MKDSGVLENKTWWEIFWFFENTLLLLPLLFRPLDIERNFDFGCVCFFFVFNAKSGTTNNHRNGSSDKSH